MGPLVKWPVWEPCISLPPSLSGWLAGVERATERLADGWTGGDGGPAAAAAAHSLAFLAAAFEHWCHRKIQRVPVKFYVNR